MSPAGAGATRRPPPGRPPSPGRSRSHACAASRAARRSRRPRRRPRGRGSCRGRYAGLSRRVNASSADLQADTNKRSIFIRSTGNSRRLIARSSPCRSRRARCAPSPLGRGARRGTLARDVGEHQHAGLGDLEPSARAVGTPASARSRASSPTTCGARSVRAERFTERQRRSPASNRRRSRVTTRIDHCTQDGKVIRTSYAYDRETFRLTHLYTRRGVDPLTAQGVSFTDDCDNRQPPPPTIAAPRIRRRASRAACRTCTTPTTRRETSPTSATMRSRPSTSRTSASSPAPSTPTTPSTG